MPGRSNTVKVKKSAGIAAPEYPTRRQLLSYGMILGAAAVTLGTVAGGCRHTGGTPPEIATTGGVIVTGGAMPVEPQVESCVVQKGDTLYGIAKRTLGDGSRWPDIAAANPGITPKGLKAGQTLTIPTIPPK